ncbi:hypothetical protein CPB86DRAFT_329478 [Serendipita vermifera]|nr:hypothetical protein CPB86DRAFT_329478 [Serendipita vermifera]
MKGSPTFRTLDHKLFSLVTQARTGHGHYGTYYRDFNILESHECLCGEPLQTRSSTVPYITNTGTFWQRQYRIGIWVKF